MADVIVDPENSNPKELVSQGVRAYVLQDYHSAVAALGKASELLATEHGDDLHDSLGDVYLYYGKALLELSRQEAEPLGDAIPKGDEEDSDEGAEEDGDEVEAKSDEPENGEKGDAKANESVSEDGNDSRVEGNGDADVSKNEEPSSSTNGERVENEDDEEPTDLQVGWEILELAKKIFEKRGEAGKKQLAETMTVLGEISLESENFEAAVNDLKAGLAIQQELYNNDSRAIAETCYNLGIALVFNTQMEEAATYLIKSLECLKNRILVLESQDSTEAKNEINEIKGLMPELEEKIADVKNYKEEALKTLSENLKKSETGFTSGSSPASASSTSVSNISHLVKRKRKPEESEASPTDPKKPTP